ncbi:unnamed protein product [Camellia sinensis]
MKIKCDVCEREEATVFCSADEAALCDGCDRRVHHANKVAAKHIRFSLLHPSFKESPRCDLCQVEVVVLWWSDSGSNSNSDSGGGRGDSGVMAEERRAFLFCQEDRAILCRECDIPIHKANEHTQKHNRFLLTGVRISPPPSSPYSCQASLSSKSSGDDIVANDSEIKYSVSNKSFNTDNALPSTSIPSRVDEDRCMNSSQERSVSTSSISEYLMETLPGWRVDDFLDPSCFPHGFCENYDNELRLWDHGFESNLYPLSGDSDSRPLQSPPQSSHTPQCLPQTNVINSLLKKSDESQNVMKVGMKKWSEDGFTVPQISPSFKKSRQFW